LSEDVHFDEADRLDGIHVEMRCGVAIVRDEGGRLTRASVAARGQGRTGAFWGKRGTPLKNSDVSSAVL